MKIFGVTGNPILHSLSPLLFKAAYDSDFSYLRLIANSPKEALKLFNDLAMCGLNITAPFKNSHSWGDGAFNDEVLELGLTNTMVREDNGIKFYNTDIYGVSHQLSDIKNSKCLVLGAGGAGTAAVYMLKKMGAEVTIANRTLSKAAAIAEKFHCQFSDLYCDAENYDIIVNTLHQKVLNNIRINQTMVDAIYHHSPYEGCNCNYINGLQWLIGQGVASYRLFTNREPNSVAMEQIETPIYEKIIFIGKYGEDIAKSVSLKLGREILFNHELSKNDLVVWLHDNTLETQNDKETFAKIATAIIDIEKKSCDEITEKIYEEIYKTL